MREFWQLKVIWSLCMIWDVLEYLIKWNNKEINIRFEWKIYKWELEIDKTILHIVRIRTDKRKPIEKQSKECIDFVYMLYTII